MLQRNGQLALVLGLLACVAVFMVVNQADEHTLTETTAWVEAEEAGSVNGVIKAIVDLKAYCVAARDQIEDKFSGKLKSGAMEFCDAFGKNSGKELVTEFAQTVGDIEAKHATSPGLAMYLLQNMNESVLRGETPITRGTKGSDQNKVFLDPSSFGLRETPSYFKKMGVTTSEWIAKRAELHEGDSGRAIKAMTKSRTNDVFKGLYAKITAKYMAMQQAEDLLAEQGAKVSIHASYDEGQMHGKGNQIIMHPLPTAGSVGAAVVRSKRKFTMPSAEQIRTEAMDEAKAYMKKLVKDYKSLSVKAMAKKIEAMEAGTTIRLSTVNRLFADSNQSPKIKIFGTLGSIEGKIDYLPLNGAKSTQTFTEIKNLNDSVETASVGKITKIELTADRKVVNPWLCNGFEAQVGHGNMWIKFAPKDKKVGKGGFWLGGGKHDVLYGLEHKKTWTLYPAGH